MKSFLILILQSAQLLLASSTSANRNQTILQNLFADSETQIFASFLSLPRFINFTQTLHTLNQNLTLFAPNDQAFRAQGIFNSSQIALNSSLAGNLTDLLNYHFVPDYAYLFPSSCSTNSTISYGLIGGNDANSNSTGCNLQILYSNYTVNSTAPQANSTQPAVQPSKQVLVANPFNQTVINGNYTHPAAVIKPNQVSLNGVFHIVDSVFQIPLSVAAALQSLNQTSFFQSFNSTVNLQQARNVTLFAPENQYWNATNSSVYNKNCF